MKESNTVKSSPPLVMYKKGEQTLGPIICNNASVYSGKPVSFYENEGYKLYSFNEALALLEKAQDSHYIKPFKEISEDDYWYNYEVLPPEAWTFQKGITFFRISEYMTSNITAHFICHKNRYFSAMMRTTSTNKENFDEVLKLHF